ncbi:MAG: relaxase/mobilization nuclease domain-containing protein, partial [Gallicola sp.]|nr:relaxase/mobilization nuclease domain-containing protein [Gallicola sp.]
DVNEGKVYHSYYGSYMNIRNQSDRLCKEHNLSVLDSSIQADIERITKRKFTNWYDWNTDKQGSNFKTKLQRDIDKSIKAANNWDEFLDSMKALDYEIKQGKYIAFKHKDKKRFTRSKTLGDDYTETELRKWIETPTSQRTRDLDSIVDTKNNEKIQNSPAYKHWASKQNLKSASQSVLQMRDLGFKNRDELSRAIHKLSFERNEIKKRFDMLEQEQKDIKAISKHIQVCMEKKAHYDGYKQNPNDKIYYMMNKKAIETYQTSDEQIDFFIKKYPHLKVMVMNGMKDKSVFKKLNKHLDKLQTQKEQLAKEHQQLGKDYKQLNQIEKNLDDYMGQEKSDPTSILKEIQNHKESDQEKKKSKDKKLAQEER